MLNLHCVCLLFVLTSQQPPETPEQLLDRAWKQESTSLQPDWKLRQQIALQFERAGLHEKAMSVLEHEPAEFGTEQKISRAKGLHRLIRFHLKSHRAKRAMELLALMEGDLPDLTESARSTYPEHAVFATASELAREKIKALWSIALAEPESPEQTKHAFAAIRELKPAVYRDKIRYRKLSFLVSRLKGLEADQRDTVKTEQLIAGTRKWLNEFEQVPLIQFRRFGKTLADFGKVDPVVSLAESLLQKKPNDDHYRFVASDLLIAAAGSAHIAGQVNQASQLLRRARELFEDVPKKTRDYWRGDLSFAMGLAKTGHHEEAIRMSSEDQIPGFLTDMCATIYHPGHPIVWILKQQLSESRFDDALTLAARFSDSNDQLRAKAMVAKATAANGDTEKAAEILAELDEAFATTAEKEGVQQSAVLPLELSGDFNSTKALLAVAAGELADPSGENDWLVAAQALSSERRKLIEGGEVDRVLSGLHPDSVSATEIIDFAETGHEKIAMSLLDRLVTKKFDMSKLAVIARIGAAAIQEGDITTLKQAIEAAEPTQRQKLCSALVPACRGTESQPLFQLLIASMETKPVRATASDYARVEDYDKAFQLAKKSDQLSYVAHSLLYQRKYDAAIRFMKAAPEDASRSKTLESLCRELAEQDRVADALSLVAIRDADKPKLQTAIAAGILDGKSVPRLWKGLQRNMWGNYSISLSLDLLP